ncbi:ABC transporter permease [Anaerolentibacter hominis]|uniref:ABC transporter permease n=1 Tax=Anaerolentibacter hominis TaxID=3079009 RepID=UPI003CCE62E6
MGSKMRSFLTMLGIIIGVGSVIILVSLMQGMTSTMTSTFDRLTATPSFGAILLSFGVSVGIGVGFGYLPASKAARLNPIDALRNE